MADQTIDSNIPDEYKSIYRECFVAHSRYNNLKGLQLLTVKIQNSGLNETKSYFFERMIAN